MNWQKTKRPMLKFLSYFWGPILYMIEAVALPSRNLVPRDIIRIRLGDVLPADKNLNGNT